MNIFTYGSLMFDEVWRPIAVTPVASMTAELVGFAREGVVGERYPGIRVKPGAVTVGRVYLEVDAQTLARLDAFEGDEYLRSRVTVQVRGRRGRLAQIDAEVYVFADPRRLDGKSWDPDRFARDDASGFYRTHARL